MKLPTNVREEFRRFGRRGGEARARRLPPERRRSVARRGALLRWIRARFGDSSFAALGLPGGDVIDAGLADLVDGRETIESLLVSLAAPRLRREGVPVTGSIHPEPESRLYELLSTGPLAHARYLAHLRQVVSFADACRLARRDRGRRAP
jgi:hypothetical protein